jgi:hypothetical protein
VQAGSTQQGGALSQAALCGCEKSSHPAFLGTFTLACCRSSIAAILVLCRALCDLYDLLFDLTVPLATGWALPISVVFQSVVAPNADLVSTRTWREGQVGGIEGFAAQRAILVH